MPINIPDDLPAKDILESEKIFAIEDKSAHRQRIRPLKIVILNLMPKKIETETQDQTKDNIVLKQNKKPGTKTRKNKTIKVYIGKYTKTYITENYTGKNINEVMSILDNNNIKYEIKYKETNDYENYIVISQTPSKNTKLKDKEVIVLTVAKNKEPITENNQTKNEDKTEENNQ